MYMQLTENEISKARDSRAAIERLYIEMRHLFNRGWFRQNGPSGGVLADSLKTLSPEIYGSMTDPNKVELDGLVYVIDRLPKGIEECHFVKLVSEEGLNDSGFSVLIPAKRRRNCYRIDKDRMYIEVTRGRSEIYDILTHLTFLYLEADKIARHARDDEGNFVSEWKELEAIVNGDTEVHHENRDVALTYLSTLLGRSFSETRFAYQRLESESKTNNGLFKIVYHLAHISMTESEKGSQRTISFSPTLRDRIGHHMYGERWANQIKGYLESQHLLDRPLHIISANLHSVMNSLFGWPALSQRLPQEPNIEKIALELSKAENQLLRNMVAEYAELHGMFELDDPFGTNMGIQIFDTAKLDLTLLAPELQADAHYLAEHKPVILVMDYAFGEQAYETMDELIKPYFSNGNEVFLNVASINIMGKAGILEGEKGDIMVPTSHVFEGTADNYPIQNDFTCDDFAGEAKFVCAGPMITVLGTSLQNRDVLAYFKLSSWGAIGLEMEGAHYQKAIQAATLIRQHINRHVTIRYAYYASDNPLVTGNTLASGSLGLVGVKPTYLITRKILQRILSGVKQTASVR